MANWIYWTVFGTALLVTWAIRYHKALKTLQKPKFWISFVVITMLSSYIFSKFQNFDKGVWDGLYIGLQMNFRAAIMVIGFTVIGKEFSNPQIGKFLQKTNFRQLFLSLEVAFETLPFVMANLPSFKDFFKQPVSIIYKMISQAEFWLGKITVRLADKPMIYIITGSSGDGKTSVLKDLIDALKTKNIKVSGFISPAVVADNKRIGYDLLDLSNGKNTELSRGYELHDSVKIGKFHFCKMGVEFGNNALQLDNTKDSQLICVDEVGPWEMDDKGWASGLNNLLMNSKTPMIWVVRQSLVDEVIENWNLKKNKIFDVNNTNKELLIDEVVHGLLI
jgi:nucleoside-triphosphatase THEP1